MTPIDVGDAIIRANQMKLFEPAAVHAEIGRLAKPGRTGIVTVRKALELIMIGDRPATSALEFRFHIGPGRFGIPPYEYQHQVRLGARKLYIDFAYPDVMLAIEVDGYEKRASRAALDYDDDRANKLVLAGWTILRFTWTQVVNDPARVASEILTLLGRLGHRFGG